MKIRRERHKKRQDLKIQTDKQPKSLYFDGRKDHTIINQKIDNKYYRNKITEEHITLMTHRRARVSIYGTLYSCKWNCYKY